MLVGFCGINKMRRKWNFKAHDDVELSMSDDRMALLGPTIMRTRSPHGMGHARIVRWN